MKRQRWKLPNHREPQPRAPWEPELEVIDAKTGQRVAHAPGEPSEATLLVW